MVMMKHSSRQFGDYFSGFGRQSKKCSRIGACIRRNFTPCSYIKSDGKNDKTAKGIQKNVMKNNIKHIIQWCSIVTQNENHLNCKSSNRQLRIEQNFI